MVSWELGVTAVRLALLKEIKIVIDCPGAGLRQCALWSKAQNYAIHTRDGDGSGEKHM